MKVHVRDLKGKALDYTVAKIQGESYRDRTHYDGIGNEYPPHLFSSNWEQAGPIIQDSKIDLFRFDGNDGVWHAGIFRTDPGKTHRHQVEESGPDMLTAAMRCYVVSKLGNEVDIPEKYL